MAEVARRAGVAKSTASKALNGRPDVSVAVRERVRRAASELGYVRRIGSLGGVVAFVTDSMTTTYTLEVMRGVVSAATCEGVGVLAQCAKVDADCPGGVPFEVGWLERLVALGCLGVVVVTAQVADDQIARAVGLGLPLVVVDPANPLPGEVVCISATNWNGGVEAAGHLIGLGHARVAFLRGPRESVPSNERMQGYLSALQMHGLPVDERLVVGSSFAHDDGLRVARELLDLPEGVRPTAVFAATDVTALAVLEAARERGLAVPDDLSVVGFDDTFLAELSTPRLTTVRQPLEEMGATALRQVLALSAGRPALSGTVRLPTELVIRSSTRPL